MGCSCWHFISFLVSISSPQSVFYWERSRLMRTRLVKYEMKAVFPHHKVCLLGSAFHQSLNMKVIPRQLAKKPHRGDGF